ncbi:uncharacterized protein LOC107271099 [Cephus cinctus]|uniref:Uncharacterized protein LOC107271099 n=1 Tax=Cephus cinctus TaxID=211228 RepID=A0AAJ7C553_CEPCN|nr:uncharacterized protein LOC107271099 [Cephus cinctus]
MKATALIICAFVAVGFAESSLGLDDESRGPIPYVCTNTTSFRKDGNVDLSVGGQKLPGRRVEPTVGLSGTYRFRRSPEPQGSLSATYVKPLDGPERRPTYNFDYNNRLGSLSGTFSKPFGGPERRPTYNFDYNHRLVNRKDGNIDLSVGGQKLPGRRVEPTVGLSGTFRFRRSFDSEN